MSMKKTPWFSGRCKPVRPGVYETGACLDERFQYWDGKRWGYFMPSVKAAYEHRDRASSEQRPFWRGLASKPKSTP